MIGHAALRSGVAVACFGAFVLGAWLSAPRWGDAAPSRKRRASLLALWTVVVSLAIGVTERDMYPFTSWPLVAWIYPKSVWYSRYFAVDTAGGEHMVDFRAWQPLSVDELSSFMASDFLRLDSAARDDVARDLLRRANLAAQQVLAGQAPGRYSRLLGPFSAPLFHLHPASWTGSAALPPLPLRGLRLYTETWDPDERARSPDRVTRRLLYEFRSDR